MKQEPLILEYWNENVGISWWKESRVELNKIIKKFNEWQTKHNMSLSKVDKLLTKIENGKNTIGSQNGGSGYYDELDVMEKFVRKTLKELLK